MKMRAMNECGCDARRGRGGGSNWRLSKLLELEAAVRDLCYAASLPAFVALIMRVCVCATSSSLFVLASLCMYVCVCVRALWKQGTQAMQIKRKCPTKCWHSRTAAAGLASGIAKPKPKLQDMHIKFRRQRRRTFNTSLTVETEVNSSQLLQLN